MARETHLNWRTVKALEMQHMNEQLRRAETPAPRVIGLWDYQREGWGRRFFEHWRAALKWQRLRPYEEFAASIDPH